MLHLRLRFRVAVADDDWTKLPTADAVWRRACAGQAQSLPPEQPARSRAVFVTAIIYGLIGLVLAAGGIWLAALGRVDLLSRPGISILATALLLAQRRQALWLFAIVLVGTCARACPR